MLQLYRLRDGVAFRRFDRCTVILDTKADRYWMIAGHAAITLAWVGGSVSTAVHPEQIRRLLDLRLIEPASVIAAGGRPRAVPPARSALFGREGPMPAFSLRHAVAVGYWSIAAWIGLRTRRFDQLLAIVEARRRYPPRSPRNTIEDVARAFTRYRRLVPLPRICLPDSLAFLAFAAWAGHHPRLVFGVIAHPFAAHCWVQQDDMVLNDALDHAGQFSPILVI